MINNIKSTLLISLSVVIVSCSKSGKKALEKGNYYNASVLAIEKLKKEPNNTKAIEVLPQSYKLASQELIATIEKTKLSSQPFKWEIAFEAHKKLNNLYDLIENCSSCKRLVNPKEFFNEMEETREFAAKERYLAGTTLLNQRTISSGRSAYENFEKLLSYAPNYKDATQKLDEALNMGSYHVVIEQPKINARLYEYSYEYFQSQVNDFLSNNRRMNKFIRFYDPKEAEEIKLKPDHVIRLEFIDFVVGQSKLESKQSTVESADSVKTGTAIIKGEKVDVYAKVKAQITENKKQIRSYGVMSMQIFDYQSQRSLLTRELAGEFNWFNEWTTFNGDERALTPTQSKMLRNREELPPPPQQLFIEFCKPIYDQFTTQVRSFYKNY